MLSPLNNNGPSPSETGLIVSTVVDDVAES